MKCQGINSNCLGLLLARLSNGQKDWEPLQGDGGDDEEGSGEALYIEIEVVVKGLRANAESTKG